MASLKIETIPNHNSIRPNCAMTAIEIALYVQDPLDQKKTSKSASLVSSEPSTEFWHDQDNQWITNEKAPPRQHILCMSGSFKWLPSNNHGQREQRLFRNNPPTRKVPLYSASPRGITFMWCVQHSDRHGHPKQVWLSKERGWHSHTEKQHPHHGRQAQSHLHPMQAEEYQVEST